MSEQADAQTQKALIVFSDGQDTISLKSFRDALDATVIRNVQIYSIDRNDSAGYEPGKQVLRAFAAASGGRFFEMKDGSARALNTILEGYRASYVVSYHLPTRAQGFHTVQVLPTHNVHFHFRSRSGHYYPDYIR